MERLEADHKMGLQYHREKAAKFSKLQKELELKDVKLRGLVVQLRNQENALKAVQKINQIQENETNIILETSDFPGESLEEEEDNFGTLSSIQVLSKEGELCQKDFPAGESGASSLFAEESVAEDSVIEADVVQQAFLSRLSPVASSTALNRNNNLLSNPPSSFKNDKNITTTSPGNNNFEDFEEEPIPSPNSVVLVSELAISQENNLINQKHNNISHKNSNQEKLYGGKNQNQLSFQQKIEAAAGKPRKPPVPKFDRPSSNSVTRNLNFQNLNFQNQNQRDIQRRGRQKRILHQKPGNYINLFLIFSKTKCTFFSKNMKI